MLAEAEPKPRRRRKESACGAAVARCAAWVGPLPASEWEQDKSWQLVELPALLPLLGRCKTSWSHCPVVDADVVDQAGEETLGGLIGSAANVETSMASLQAVLLILGHKRVVHIEAAADTIPHKSYSMPDIICDDSIRNERRHFVPPRRRRQLRDQRSCQSIDHQPVRSLPPSTIGL